MNTGQRSKVGWATLIRAGTTISTLPIPATRECDDRNHAAAVVPDRGS